MCTCASECTRERGSMCAYLAAQLPSAWHTNELWSSLEWAPPAKTIQNLKFVFLHFHSSASGEHGIADYVCAYVYECVNTGRACTCVCVCICVQNVYT
jgi:hypothetical protein